LYPELICELIPKVLEIKKNVLRPKSKFQKFEKTQTQIPHLKNLQINFIMSKPGLDLQLKRRNLTTTHMSSPHGDKTKQTHLNILV
jgi:hypothetical protein